MSRNLTFILATLFILLTFSTPINRSPTVDYRYPGVKVGDTAMYSYSSDGGFELIVTNVEGTRVSFQTISSRTGSPSLDHSVDVQLLNGGKVEYLIAANLSAGDAIFQEYGNTWVINETISMIVAGSLRTVNHMEFLPINAPPNRTEPVLSYDMCWDKVTGLTVEAHIITMVGWFNWTMTSLPTNVGVPSSDMTVLLLAGGGVAAVLVTVAVIAIAARRK